RRCVPYHLSMVVTEQAITAIEEGNYDASLKRQKPDEQQARYAGLPRYLTIVMVGNKQPRRMRGSSDWIPSHCFWMLHYEVPLCQS
ncbi:hypothetical protein Q6247_25670, partial [Klebsiella pneumoniae]